MDYLDCLRLNQSARIVKINSKKYRRFWETGFVPGSIVTPLFKSAFGGSVAYEINNAVIVLRNEDARLIKIKKIYKHKIKTIALAGNPNVGKSTIFNNLTGLKQHTGNWHGKTVDITTGYCKIKGDNYQIVDLPGTYSLQSDSPDESIARNYIMNKKVDIIVVIADASSLKRSLNLFLQIREINENLILCINLIDQATRKGIKIDIEKLRTLLEIEVIGISASRKNENQILKNAISNFMKNKEELKYLNSKTDDLNDLEGVEDKFIFAHQLVADTGQESDINSRDNLIDRYVTSKIFGIPIMLCFLGILFWLTIIGANYPSMVLSEIFNKLRALLSLLPPMWFRELIIEGLYTPLSYVVAVMLPPMAIFFPLFKFLEDLGYLPRIAFNLDNCFKKSCACGKQALTMCMGFGCNAAGVTGTKIIGSKRERLIAILTNVFVPCNGRFPLFIALSGAFMDKNLHSVMTILGLVILGVFLTFSTSKILSLTILKGTSETFILELPPYRKPQIFHIILGSLANKTLHVLMRAVSVAAPAGIVIWIIANNHINNISILQHCASYLDSFAQILGLDGYILLSFILALPANEIVLPIIIMAYMSSGSMAAVDSHLLREVLTTHGWNLLTAINVMIFSLAHFPCGTTLLTIWKETNSLKWTVASFLIPTIEGLILCFITTQIFQLFPAIHLAKF